MEKTLTTHKSPEKIATRDGFGKGLLEYGRKNGNVISVEADLGKSTKSLLFSKEFPERQVNVGVSEADMMLVSCGLAASGKIPFASTFAIFTERAFEQIRNAVCRMNLNVKVIGSHAGMITGEDGSSAQCIEDIAVFRTLPNMAVVCPADAVEAEKAVEAIALHKGPVYMRLYREKTPVIFDSKHKFTIGKGTVLADGKDVAVFAYGPQVHEAMLAHEELKKQGITAKIINMSTVKPLDKELVIASAKTTGALVTAEDHSIIGGLGGAVAECLAENFPCPLERVGVNDTFGESGKPADLYKKYRLSSSDIVTAAIKAIRRNKK